MCVYIYILYIYIIYIYILYIYIYYIYVCIYIYIYSDKVPHLLGNLRITKINFMVAPQPPLALLIKKANVNNLEN